MNKSRLAADLLFGKDIVVNEKVSIKIPKVEDIVYLDNFSKYTSIFTITTRELFSSMREVDELEQKYPTVWKMMFDPTGEGDKILGQVFGEESLGSDIFIQSLAFWTGLKAEGFQKLSNKKFVNESVDWIIDVGEFNRLAKFIIMITCYEASTSFTAPKNMTEGRFQAWKSLLDGRIKMAQRNQRTMADKILILSISTESYIPIEQIGKMSYFQFCKLYEALTEKEAYKHRWDVRLSTKFDDGGQKLQHWKETLKITK